MSEEFRARIREKIRLEHPELDEVAVEDAVSAFWASWLANPRPDIDPFLAGSRRPTLPVPQEFLLDQVLNWGIIAQEFIKRNPLWYDRAGLWWAWNHLRKCYEHIDETDVLNMVDGAVRRNNYKSNVKAEVLEALRRESRKTEPADPPKSWVQFNNGVYDVKEGKKLGVSHRYFITNPIPWSVSESIETPVIDALLKDWSGDSWLILKQLLAYCCLPDYTLHRIFVLHGSGLNGKGTFLRLLTKFVGEKNCTSTELDLILANQFHVSKLHKRLVAMMGETNIQGMKNTSMLKKLSGGEFIGFEYKGKTPFDDYNTAKIIIGTNSLPVTHDRTDGFYRRFIIIDFKTRFTEKRDVLAEIPDAEFENLATWCVKELERLLREREFSNEGTIEERRERYEARSDTLQLFIEKQCSRDLCGVIGAGEFYDRYSAFLIQHGHRKLTYSDVRTSLKEKGYEHDRRRVNGAENAISVVTGLRFVSTVSDVSALSGSSLRIEDKPKTDDTADTLTQGKTLLERFRDLFSGNYDGKPAQIEAVQRKLDITDQTLEHWKRTGEAVENPAGWIRPS